MIAAKKLLMASGFVPDPDARALIERMSPKPSVGRQRAINELIVAMKNGGSWARMKNFYVLAAHAQQAALLNWKGDTDTLSVSGALSFVPDTGVPGSTTNRLSYNMDLRSTTEFGAGGFVSYTGSQ